MVPMVLPVLRQRPGNLPLAPVEEVERQFVLTQLPQAELVASLGNEISSAGVEAPREHVHGQCKPVAIYLKVVTAIYFDPLVGLIQVDRVPPGAGHPASAAHRGDLGIVRRRVLEHTVVFRDTRADEVPDGSAHGLFMLVYHPPVVGHASGTVARDGQVFIHERRSQVKGIEAVKYLMFER